SAGVMKRGLGWSVNMTEETEDPSRIKEGGLRLLTTGEIQLAHSVFLSTIDYSKSMDPQESYSLSIYRIIIRR
ncbi:hypothetical protein ACVXG7_22150, partial [Enterobacter hormaechei]